MGTVFIAGGTGFVGSHLLEAFSRDSGVRARCLVRSAARAGHCTDKGFETFIGDITDRPSLRTALLGVETVFHLVGLIEEAGPQTFQRVVVEGTRNLIDEARLAGVGHFVYVSSLGANPDSPHRYLKSKALAEQAVMDSGIPYTIFRPSLVIGSGGGFVGKLKDIIALPGPIVPVPGGGETKFQPIYVGDLSRCLTSVIGDPEAKGRVYELGGPEQLSYNTLLLMMAEVMGKRKKLLHIPMKLAIFGARALGLLGISPVTPEQLELLGTDNICSAGCVKEEFHFEPLGFREAISLSL